MMINRGEKDAAVATNLDVRWICLHDQQHPDTESVDQKAKEILVEMMSPYFKKLQADSEE